jgi:hypothetical protein
MMPLDYTAYTLPSEVVRERLEALSHRRPRDVAKRFLEHLIVGPIATVKIIELAARKGISVQTLRRAKAELGIEARKDGPVEDGQSTWQWHPCQRTAVG